MHIAKAIEKQDFLAAQRIGCRPIFSGTSQGDEPEAAYVAGVSALLFLYARTYVVGALKRASGEQFSVDSENC